VRIKSLAAETAVQTPIADPNRRNPPMIDGSIIGLAIRDAPVRKSLTARKDAFSAQGLRCLIETCGSVATFRTQTLFDDLSGNYLQ
jgi:hypothetical protein